MSSSQINTLPALAGSEKQAAWATKIRAELLNAFVAMTTDAVMAKQAEQMLDAMTTDTAERDALRATLAEVVAAYRERIAHLATITEAKFWIDNRPRPFPVYSDDFRKLVTVPLAADRLDLYDFFRRPGVLTADSLQQIDRLIAASVQAEQQQAEVAKVVVPAVDTSAVAAELADLRGLVGPALSISIWTSDRATTRDGDPLVRVYFKDADGDNVGVYYHRDDKAPYYTRRISDGPTGHNRVDARTLKWDSNSDAQHRWLVGKADVTKITEWQPGIREAFAAIERCCGSICDKLGCVSRTLLVAGEVPA